MKKYLTYLLLLTLLTTSGFAYDIDYEGDTPFGLANTTNDHPEPEFMEVDEGFNNDSTATDEEGRTLKTYPNIRIAGYYGSLSSAPSGFRSYMTNSLGPAVIDYYQAALKVKYPINGRLILSHYSSVCNIPIPSNMRRDGVPADLLILFVSTHDSGKNWVAEAFSCILSVQSKRPLIGKVNVNRALYKDPGSDILLHEKNIYLMLHEVAHVLGFSGHMFRYYLDENGRQRSGHILTRTLDGISVKVINVPPLTTRLRRFFGCSSLAGAYMEGTGSSATAGSHFERRMLPFDALTSGLIYQQSLSEFTLAMLEGSGWYLPDYSMADPYWFGQGQGCNFLMQSCTNPNFKFEEFCSGRSRGCTVQGRGGGTCAGDIRSNNCRFVFPNVNYDCENPSASRNARYPSVETYGRNENSKCFTGTLSPTSSSASSTNFCFKYQCVGQGLNTQLRVRVGNLYYTCKYKGILRPRGYNGYFDCPDPLTFCQTVGKPACPRGCMGRGICVDGKCQCRRGFFGKDCAENRR